MKTKKAELSSELLVSIILLILGFGVLLFVYTQIYDTSIVDEKVCHESVVMRATFPDVAGAKDFVPLKCHAKKICITSKTLPLIQETQKCEADFKNEKGIEILKVNKKEQIERAISQEILSCWEMMGEGKVSIFSEGIEAKYGIGSVLSHCVICSRIAFDPTLKNEMSESEIASVNPLQYMMSHKVPGKDISYHQQVVGDSTVKVNANSLGDKTTLEKLMEEIEHEKEYGQHSEIEFNLESSASLPQTSDAAQIDDELAIVFMQISSPDHGKALLNTVLGAGIISGAGAYVVGPSIFSVVKPILSVKAAIPALALALIAGAYQQANIYYQRGVTAGYCGDISTGENARGGCTVVRAMKYDISELSKYCNYIESIS